MLISSNLLKSILIIITLRIEDYIQIDIFNLIKSKKQNDSAIQSGEAVSSSNLSLCHGLCSLKQLLMTEIESNDLATLFFIFILGDNIWTDRNINKHIMI